MGCDIKGWVEVKENDYWFDVINISSLVGRNYDIFGLLFGVRKYIDVKPIAEKRGIPKNISLRIIKELQFDFHSHSFSYIYYSEIKKIDWNKDVFDLRIHFYKKEKGKWIYKGKFGWSSFLDNKNYRKQIREKGYIIINDEKYIYKTVKLKNILSDDWKLLFNLMGLLAKKYGDENVRMVVWFYD